MARGFATALQAALAGVAGGASGYAKYQQQMKEEQERMREIERQRVRDALAQSQFDLSAKEFEARFGPEAIARQERQRKVESETRLRERAEDLALEREKIAAQSRNTASAVASARQAQRQDDLSAAEAWWNDTMATQRSSPEAQQRARRIADTFNRLRAANKRKDPREIFLGMYEAEQQAQKSRIEQAKAAGTPEGAAQAMREPMYRPTEESVRLRGEPPRPTLSPADQWEQIVQEEMAKGKTREQAEAEATRRLGE
jgi:hypothetical protein